MERINWRFNFRLWRDIHKPTSGRVFLMILASTWSTIVSKPFYLLWPSWSRCKLTQYSLNKFRWTWQTNYLMKYLPKLFTKESTDSLWLNRFVFVAINNGKCFGSEKITFAFHQIKIPYSDANRRARDDTKTISSRLPGSTFCVLLSS